MRELDPTTKAIIAADQAHLDAANDEVLWERRGLLQSLARTDRPDTGWWRRTIRVN